MGRAQTGFVAAVVLSGSMLAAVGVSGCLFPSFDDLLGDAGSASSAAETDGGPKSNGQKSDGGSTRDDQDGTATAPDEDGGTTSPQSDGGGTTPGPRVIACGSKTCNMDTSYCCVSFGSGDCNSNDDVPFCQSILRCDGNQDCPGSTVCCAEEFSNEAACKTSCSSGGRIVCQPDAPQCPTGKSCTGRQDIGGITAAFCQ